MPVFRTIRDTRKDDFNDIDFRYMWLGFSAGEYGPTKSQYYFCARSAGNKIVQVGIYRFDKSTQRFTGLDGEPREVSMWCSNLPTMDEVSMWCSNLPAMNEV